jgi:hypothetical protein
MMNLLVYYYYYYYYYYWTMLDGLLILWRRPVGGGVKDGIFTLSD